MTNDIESRALKTTSLRNMARTVPRLSVRSSAFVLLLSSLLALLTVGVALATGPVAVNTDWNNSYGTACHLLGTPTYGQSVISSTVSANWTTLNFSAWNGSATQIVSDGVLTVTLHLTYTSGNLTALSFSGANRFIYAAVAHGGSTADNLYYYTPTGVATSTELITLAPNISNLFLCYNASPTAVKLSSFSARASSEAARALVVLNWITGNEVNSAGFNIYRSENPAGPYGRVNPQLIPATNSAIAGGQYEFQDATVESGKTYYYQLEDIEVNGTSTRHDPVQVNAPQATASANLPLLVGAGLGAFALIAVGLIFALKKWHTT